MESVNETEKAFIKFYNDMATSSAHSSDSNFVAIPSSEKTQTGSAVTVVSPTQATVQQAKKQAIAKSPMMRKRAASAAMTKKRKRPASKKKTPAKKAKRAKAVAKKKKAIRKKPSSSKKPRGASRAMKKNKAQKKRVQKGGSKKR